MKPTVKDLYKAWLPIREIRTLRSLRSLLEAAKPKRNSVICSIHWDGCWEVHRECALRELNRIEKK